MTERSLHFVFSQKDGIIYFLDISREQVAELWEDPWKQPNERSRPALVVLAGTDLRRLSLSEGELGAWG